ncbi:MAG: hypothetical protein LBS21_05935 [Clostridiales bacterium]|jgi:ubiquitin-protein ligase|nr:hypothetical protein [Clostridiales bacterium]
MTSQDEKRKLMRFSSEEKQMAELAVEGFITVEGLGDKPYRQYKVSVNAQSFCKNTFAKVNGPHVFTIKASAGYPKDAPVATFTSVPIAHINVYENGNVCIGAWNPQETMASTALRIVRLILMDPKTFNFKSMADKNCEVFCKGRCGEEILPSPALPGISQPR